MSFIFLILFALNFLSLYDLKSARYQQSEGPYFYDVEALNGRRPQFPIHPLILSRRSLRMMSGATMTDKELFPLFEAARWAPSNYNIQEWRFVYAKRNTRHFVKFLELLSPNNQKWAKDASVLLVVVSNMYNTHKGNKTFVRTHSFDTGMAFMSMALEASARGYVVHPMAGFDYDRAARVIRLDTRDYNVEAMVAIGKRKALRSRATNEKTTQRNPIKDFISEGIFTEKRIDSQ